MQIFPETQDQWVFSDDVTAAILVSKTMEGRPCWCSQQILWELNSFLRDGPLEKLWGEGNFRAAGIFFRYQIPCMNFF